MTGAQWHDFNAHNIVGVELEHAEAPRAIASIMSWAKARRGGYICVPNVHACVTAREDIQFDRALRGAALRLTDSRIVQIARWFLHGAKPPETLLGSRLMFLLCERAAAEGLPIGLFGAAIDTLYTLAARLRAEFPTLKIVYAYSPPFRDLSAEERLRILEEIDASGARLLFVGLGCPKQEKWMHEAAPRLQRVTQIGVGAAFDTLAMKVKESPPWVHENGLEWLHRLTQEPKRLWRRYFLTSPRFVWLVLSQKFRFPIDGPPDGMALTDRRTIRRSR